jgi:maltose O-acetyltransferase
MISQNVQTKITTFVFGAFTYLERPIWFVLSLLPKTLRKVFYKLVFAEFGTGSFIDESCYFRYPWRIEIGDRVIINRGCQIYPSFFDDTKICIGNDAVLGPNVTLFGAGQDPRNPKVGNISGGIVIGSGVYIGGNSTIRYGVVVGEGAAIAAGSMVVKNVPDNVLVGGVPAQLIRRLRR